MNKEKVVAAIRLENSAKLELAKIDKDRRWGLDAAKFIFDNQALIFSKDINESLQMKNVMFVTFTFKMLDNLFHRIETIVPDDKQKRIWRDI